MAVTSRSITFITAQDYEAPIQSLFVYYNPTNTSSRLQDQKEVCSRAGRQPHTQVSLDKPIRSPTSSRSTVNLSARGPCSDRTTLPPSTWGRRYDKKRSKHHTRSATGVGRKEGLGGYSRGRRVLFGKAKRQEVATGETQIIILRTYAMQGSGAGTPRIT